MINPAAPTPRPAHPAFNNYLTLHYVEILLMLDSCITLLRLKKRNMKALSICAHCQVYRLFYADNYSTCQGEQGDGCRDNLVAPATIQWTSLIYCELADLIL